MHFTWLQFSAIFSVVWSTPLALSSPFRKLHIGEAGLSLVERLEANRTHWPIYGLSSEVCSYHGRSMAICSRDSSFQRADGAHCVRDGPFRCVWEIFRRGCTRFGDLSSWEPAGGACLGRWGSLMEYWQIRLSARFDRGETPHTILPLPTNGAH